MPFKNALAPIFAAIFGMNLMVTLVIIRFYRNGFWRTDYLNLSEANGEFIETGVQSMNETLLTTGVNKDH